MYKGVEGVKSSFAISSPSVHINHEEEKKAAWLKMSTMRGNLYTTW